MISEKEVADYYAGNNLILPPYSNLRQFKVNLSGKWIKIRKTIRNNKDLTKELLKLDTGKISAVYYSLALWLNPLKLKGNASNNLLLRDTTPLEIDGDGSLRGLMLAHKEAVRLLDWIEANNLELLYIAFSNRKGFHLPCRGPKLPIDPLKRIPFVAKNRKILKHKLDKEGIGVCSHSLLDPFRIFKVPGSLDKTSHGTTTLLSKEELRLPFNKLLAKINETAINGLRFRKESKKEGDILESNRGLMHPKHEFYH